MLSIRHSSIHTQTPDVIVFSSTQHTAKVLRFLRSPLNKSEPARILGTLTLKEISMRTTRLYGARPLLDSGGATCADAVTTTTIVARPLRLQTADGDTALTIGDVTGRPLWSQNAQITVTTVEYEPSHKQDTRNQAAGRPLTISEQSAGSTARIRERFTYAGFDSAHKDLNLAGTRYAHHHNAGFSMIKSQSLSGQPLVSEIHLLVAGAVQPDWKIENNNETEQPLITSATHDSTGTTLTATNAAMVTTITSHDISGAIAETRLRYVSTDEKLTADMVTLNNFRRQADGTVLSQCAGNGVAETFEYDKRTRYLTRHVTSRPLNHPCGALLFSDLHYMYDPAGNITTLEDKATDPQWHSNQQATGLRTYTYDTSYRLTSATGRKRIPLARYSTDATGGSVWSPYTEVYEYDDGDNLACISHMSGGFSHRHEFSIAAGSNRGLIKDQDLTPEDGFLAGGLQKRLADGRRLSWYADNQLRQVISIRRTDDEAHDSETYHYADGGTRTRKVRTIRTSKSTQTIITTYAGGCEVRQLLQSGQATPRKHFVISHCDCVRLLEDLLGGKKHLRYSFSDHLGSIAGETCEDGRITAREEYAPWGNTVGKHEEAVEVCNLMLRTHRYAGRELDSTGLIYYGWRYYQPGSGRWLSADPGELIDGVNLFRFCRNNPVNIIDTDGRGCVSSKTEALPQDPLVIALNHASSNYNSNLSPDKIQHKLDTDILGDIVRSENSRAGKHESRAPGTIKYYNNTGSFAFSLFRDQQKTAAIHYQAVVHMQPDFSTRGHVTAFDVYKPQGGGRTTLVNVESAIRESLTRERGQLSPEDAVESGLKSLEQAINPLFPHNSKRPRIQLHETIAQKSPNDCGIFSIANARIMSQFPDDFIQLHEKFSESLEKNTHPDFIHDGVLTELLAISSKFFKYTHSDTLLDSIKNSNPSFVQGSAYKERNQKKELRTTRGSREMNIGIEIKRHVFLRHAIKYYNR